MNRAAALLIFCCSATAQAEECDISGVERAGRSYTSFLHSGFHWVGPGAAPAGVEPGPGGDRDIDCDVEVVDRPRSDTMNFASAFIRDLVTTDLRFRFIITSTGLGGGSYHVPFWSLKTANAAGTQSASLGAAINPGQNSVRFTLQEWFGGKGFVETSQSLTFTRPTDASTPCADFEIELLPAAPPLDARLVVTMSCPATGQVDVVVFPVTHSLLPKSLRYGDLVDTVNSHPGFSVRFRIPSSR